MIKKTLGQKIREYRKRNHLTQIQLGEKLHVAQQQISRYEKDKSIPPFYTIKRMADILIIKIEKLLYEESENNSKPRNISYIVDDTELLRNDLLLEGKWDSNKQEERNNYFRKIFAEISLRNGITSHWIILTNEESKIYVDMLKHGTVKNVSEFYDKYLWKKLREEIHDE